MTRRRQPAGRKRRTREHVIADLGVNVAERAVLECGFAVERKSTDYGVDLLIDTFDRSGEIEPGQIRVQVKATDAVVRTADGLAVIQRVRVADLKAWLYEFDPVVIVAYDARADVAYWLDVQEYARAVGLDIGNTKTVSLRIPLTNRWTRDAVRRLRTVKNQTGDQYRRARDAD